MTSPPTPVTGVRLSLWRAAVAFRIVSAIVCEYLIVRWHHLYAHQGAAVLAASGIAVVTAVVAVLGLSGRAHRPAFVLGDFAITFALTVASWWVQTPAQARGGMPTITTIWAAGPVIEAGLVFGWLGGLALAAGQLAADLLVRQGYDGNTLKNGALLLITGGISGYLSSLTVVAERERVALAALAERDRLARSIHDGVLQVLGLVHRRAALAGADWAELGLAAAEQEAALRGLITSRAAAEPAGHPAGLRDLMSELVLLGSARVTVSGPADPLPLPDQAVTELVAVVRAALHNVEQHAGPGARAWVLVELLADRLCLTVRDDGCGYDPGELAAAERRGRLGVSGSIRGRVQDLGGTVQVSSAAGRGSEVEAVIPLQTLQNPSR